MENRQDSPLLTSSELEAERKQLPFVQITATRLHPANWPLSVTDPGDQIIDVIITHPVSASHPSGRRENFSAMSLQEFDAWTDTLHEQYNLLIHLHTELIMSSPTNPSQDPANHLVILDDKTTGELTVRVGGTAQFTNVTAGEVDQLRAQATTVHRCVFDDYSTANPSQP